MALDTLERGEDPELLAERVRILASQAREGTRAGIGSIVVFGILLIPSVGFLAFNIWALCLLVAHEIRYRVIQKIMQNPRPSSRDELAIGMSAVFIGLVISAPAPIFLPMMTPEVRGVFVAITVSWVAVAAMIIGIHVRIYACYIAVSYGFQALGWSRLLPPSGAIAVCVMLTLAGIVLWRFSKGLAATFEESFRIRRQNAELIANLKSSIAQTEEAQRTRTKFLATASHDLLQPVHALNLLVDVLDHSTNENSRKEAAGRIRRVAAVIADMFRGLLDQARLESGSVVPKFDSVALATVLDSIRDGYEYACLAKAIGFSIRCDPDIRVWADAAMLDRLIRNVVDNAVKFTATGAVTISVLRGTQTATIVIEDTGLGITPDEEHQVFDAFFRGSAGHKSHAEGVGLGLSVTVQMAQLLHALVRVQRRDVSGTRFEIEVPLTKVPAQQSNNDNAPRPPLLGIRTLVVEDDVQAREATHLWLRNQHCDVVSAGSLAEAKSKCEDRGFVPQIVLSDYRLGEGQPDGLDVIRAMRAAYGPIRAALVTGETLQISLADEEVVLVRKPLDSRNLRELLAPAGE